jgi:serine/threonine-protein kinase RsbW
MAGKTLEVHLPSEFGWERAALDFATRVARIMGFPADRIDDLRTALGEAIVNAIEHGNAFDGNAPVRVVFAPTPDRLSISVQDCSNRPFPAGIATREAPNIDDVIAGRISPRGWGSILIRQLVDEAEFRSTVDGNVVTMTIRRDPVGT